MKNRKELFKLDMVSVRLVNDTPLMSAEKIESPDAAVRLLGALMSEIDREAIFAVNLNTRLLPINGTMVSMGTLGQSLVDPREIFKASILSNSARIILLHNHPSGDLTPSREDIIMTNQLLQAGAIIGIPILDHIIVGSNNNQFFSFKARGILSGPDLNLSSNMNDLDFNQKLKYLNR